MTLYHLFFRAGDKVKVLKRLSDPPQDGFPGCLLADKGEEVIVREVRDTGYQWPISVSHEHITDRSFAVGTDEVVLV